MDTFKLPENKDKLEGLLKECEGVDPAQAPMAKLKELMPAVQEMMDETMKEYGYGPNDLMAVIMQIQALGPEDATIADDGATLMKAVQGDPRARTEACYTPLVAMTIFSYAIGSGADATVTKQLAC